MKSIENKGQAATGALKNAVAGKARPAKPSEQGHKK